MQNNIKEMLDQKVWTVIGVTPDKNKFGYKIYNKLKNHGYTVYGVNPKYNEVDGEKIYSTLDELPEKPTCVNMVVSPHISIQVLDEIKKQGIKYVWFQPGTFNNEVIEKAEELDLNIVHHACVLVELG
ncbi:CoA-binding protein [Serpentinicella sp. ANB-PHB4]|uniref:CoA-binding protein n=1 Tax=Serpentinicella sp. ANB-PHB4 TaxID=3074076 RepID=UPI00285CBF69|nr:CoA-binding protein [Serpentinicella sp. ANB-PHB4]MDR5657864.1 CoA-binding protein [Serpentinicella sp. ANB-PHB4]